MSWNLREIALAAAAIVLTVVTLAFIAVQPLTAVAIPPVLWAIAEIIRAIRGDGKGADVDKSKTKTDVRRGNDRPKLGSADEGELDVPARDQDVTD